MSTEIRPAVPDDAAAVSSLVQLSFRALGAANWSPEAMATFYAESMPSVLVDKLAAALFGAVATIDGAVAGFAMVGRPNRLDLLFVHPDHLRKGIGRALWEAARAHVQAQYPEVKTIELNSTAYAQPFYRSVGFVPISLEFDAKGARATRMACWLPARQLGAEIPQAGR
jgi:GNAT superfamily N-acetyltransferase